MYGQPMYYPSPISQTAQQRLQSLEAQYPQYAQNPAMVTPQSNAYIPPAIRGRFVSNEEEANAAMIDFDGSVFVFVDKPHGKVYTKQLGSDGNIIFNKYSQDGSPEKPKEASPNYVTYNCFNDKLSEMNQKIEDLEHRLTESSNKQTSKGGTK